MSVSATLALSPEGKMLPKLLFSELSGTVNGYVNFPRDL